MIIPGIGVSQDNRASHRGNSTGLSTPFGQNASGWISYVFVRPNWTGLNPFGLVLWFCNFKHRHNSSKWSTFTSSFIIFMSPCREIGTEAIWTVLTQAEYPQVGREHIRVLKSAQSHCYGDFSSIVANPQPILAGLSQYWLRIGYVYRIRHRSDPDSANSGTASTYGIVTDTRIQIRAISLRRCARDSLYSYACPSVLFWDRSRRR